MQAWRPVLNEAFAQCRHDVRAETSDAVDVVTETFEPFADPARYLRATAVGEPGQLREIGDRLQADLVEKEIIPLVQDEIWPIVDEESRPLAAKVGQEIWNEVSVFRFGWRYLYDKTPLPDRKLTEKEFNRFVDQKAIPILEAHIGDFVELQKTLLKRVSHCAYPHLKGLPGQRWHRLARMLPSCYSSDPDR